ncbi:type II toxin-antitoxin system Phd/YefM family antitoxin [Thalassobius vesicularis]|uniref:Type II toxin-antitoxin system Phd/YefM family antitoxin n=1 Tax=Thalassobius vesicularis TaxID=1294297 RepID=A0A4S3MBA0_9RHOB|nr:type II toxin-antitoxin system prevent-host-death family antitoxin [Thalassobius vesicularis]THD75877.1 type II toxin-antitoxin system Phd/YefM family antitoxin [Thalassobius vesicularis]
MLENGVLPSSYLRTNLADVLNSVRYAQRRYLITRGSQPVAALVLPHELDVVEELVRKSPAQKEYEYMARMEAWRRASVVARAG